MNADGTISRSFQSPVATHQCLALNRLQVSLTVGLHYRIGTCDKSRGIAARKKDKIVNIVTSFTSFTNMSYRLIPGKIKPNFHSLSGKA